MLKPITSQKVCKIIGIEPTKAEQLHSYKDYKHITFLADNNGFIYEKVSYKNRLLVVYVYDNRVYER